MTETGLDASPGTGRPPRRAPAPIPRHAPIPAPRHAPEPAHRTEPVLDVVVPVFNEETDLEPGVRRLHAHLRETFPYPFRITVADNASTDDTPRIAARLADELPEAEWLRLPEKGRGRALHAAWSRSRAPVLAYLDVDLSTELNALLPLVAPLLSGHSDIAIGTRLAPGARVVRGPKREVISRCYNTILRTTLGVGFSDAQCGFKAVRREAAERLLPLVRDTEWFFDTELLVLAERAGLRIHEVPVDWVDDPDSRVDLLPTALADLRGIARIARRPRPARTAAIPLRATTSPPHGDPSHGAPPPDDAFPPDRGLPPGVAPLAHADPRPDGDGDPWPQPVARARNFAAAAALAVLAHLLLYALLRPVTGAQSANALAVLVCALAGPATGRRLALPAALLLTGGSLAALHQAAPAAAHRTELAVLAAADLALALLRFTARRVRASRAGSGGHRTGAVAS